jgi:hypothetical protein
MYACDSEFVPACMVCVFCVRGEYFGFLELGQCTVCVTLQALLRGVRSVHKGMGREGVRMLGPAG